METQKRKRNISYGRIVILVTLAMASLSSCKSSHVSVPSPDGNLTLSLSQEKDNIFLSIDYKGERLISPSPIGFEFEEGPFGAGIKMSKGKLERITDEYDMPVGKASHIHSVSNQRIVSLTAPDGRKVDILLRTFNDGVAFRYLFPAQDGISQLQIRSELLELHPTGDPILKAMYLPNVACSHEAPYTTRRLSEHNEGKTADMPVLLSYDSGKHLALTEAMALDYAGMQLSIEGSLLKGRLTPRVDNPNLSVVADLPHRSPWRVFLVSDRAGALLESTILTTLCDPCEETDLTWLRPGKSTWMWWNGYQTSPEAKTGDITTLNFNISKEYIDFCAQNGIDYHSITGILKPNGQEVVWYYNEDRSPGSPGSNDSTTELYPGFDLAAICNYAKQQGVEMRVWVHWLPLSKDIEGTFRLFQALGIRGMMVDFMDRDDQEMMDFQKRVLELAMKYHLHIQFHGTSKPSGLQRTYPCEFTRENTLNYEVYKWDHDHRMGADHDLNMPFTRCLAGPADYHLGGFSSVPIDSFRVNGMRPDVTSTRCHMLAMYVVLESSLQLVADAPANYKDQPGFEFIREVPTVWDETRVPLAEIDKYVVVARRKGKEWFVGAIGNHSPRDITFPLDFLGDGAYTMELYTDAEDTDTHPNHLVKTTQKVQKSDTIPIHLGAAGGFAARLTP